MPTVLQVLPAMETGGVERGTLEIGRALIEEGWRAIVVSSGGKMLPALRGYGVEHVEAPLKTKNPLQIWRNGKRLEALIKHHGVDLVHARSRGPAWSARRAAAATKRPFVTTFHSVYGGFEQKWKRRYNSVMAEADRVIAISQWVKDHLVEIYGTDEKQIRLVPRGVDLATFDPEAVTGTRIAELVERLGLADEQRKLILLPGRVVRRKGHDLLLKAAAKLHRRDFALLFAGDVDRDSAYVREVEALISASGLGDAVRFAGDCHDMPAAFALADVVCVPSTRAEAFGRVSIEAQAMGKPVVVTACGGLAETVATGSTGWITPEQDPEALAGALDMALDLDDDQKHRLAQRARAFVSEHFSTDLMCARTLRVYRELVQG